MSNFRFRSDLALDFKELEDADGKLHFKTSQRRQVRIETLVLEKERFEKSQELIQVWHLKDWRWKHCARIWLKS